MIDEQTLALTGIPTSQHALEGEWHHGGASCQAPREARKETCLVCGKAARLLQKLLQRGGGAEAGDMDCRQADPNNPVYGVLLCKGPAASSQVVPGSQKDGAIHVHDWMAGEALLCQLRRQGAF
jgi:hypothetical protein